jgi:hypothetical protein
MGFIYSNGRLACDACGATPARKIPCPVNYCQATASCAACRPKVRALDHRSCRRHQADNAASQAELTGGLATLTLYPCKGSFGAPDFWRIRDDRHSYAACCIFNKTWLDAPDIEKLAGLGNTIVYESAEVTA